MNSFVQALQSLNLLSVGAFLFVNNIGLFIKFPFKNLNSDDSNLITGQMRINFLAYYLTFANCVRVLNNLLS